MANGIISIIGAREHNLKDVNVDLPKNKLIVVTGVSGSGKSSLAFDTLYAEGQRRYVESLSSYARQFLSLRSKPDVDSITGLSPSISVSQKSSSKNPRSTVSTVTEIHDYLRLMFARIGVPYSAKTNKQIVKLSASQISQKINDLPVGTKTHILAPIDLIDSGEYAKKILDLKKMGYVRVKVNGTVYDIDAAPKLIYGQPCDMSVVVDRVSIAPERASRISSSVENALAVGKGRVRVEIISTENGGDVSGQDSDNRILEFSEHFICPDGGFVLSKIEPKLFSFNAADSACKHCSGLGKSFTVDPSLVVQNVELSISEGALHPLGPVRLSDGRGLYDLSFTQLCSWAIVALSKKLGFDLHTPWRELDQTIRNIILFGDSNVVLGSGKMRSFKGIVGYLNDGEDNVAMRLAQRYSVSSKCTHCEGFRLAPHALSVKINGLHIGDVCAMSVCEAIEWCKELPAHISEFSNAVCSKILDEIITRLGFLSNVGLGYLTLDREASTLSGGESQRIKLVSQIGSGLTGVLYVLDEPSIGLHQRDNSLLIDTLRSLRDMENTVVVIEHDEETMLTADYIVDVGPGAGMNGGKIVACGTPDEIINNPNSITGQYMSGKMGIKATLESKTFDHWIKIHGARKNNLQNVSVSIPIGGFTCVTGVSGSGKSSLIGDTLYRFAIQGIYGIAQPNTECDGVSGLEYIDKVIEIDQSPIGRTPASNPATYIGLFTYIRSWFAGLPLSRSRGYTISRFSFNTKGGRCETCKGDSYIKIEMHFLPDVYVKCEECNGKRYNKETLEVTYKGKSIADVLDMTTDQALDFFSAIPLIREKLESLQSVGMGYVKIGQSSNTLSGGESQRIRIAKELSRRATGNTLYILDEPTTGLHISDIQNLLKILRRLVGQGNTVVVIEHNLHVIKTADYIVDIGPEGGDRGGKVVGYGAPVELVQNFPESITAQYLAPYLAR